MVCDESDMKSSFLVVQGLEGYLRLTYLNLTEFYSPILSTPMAMKRIVSNVSSHFLDAVFRTHTFHQLFISSRGMPCD